MPRARAAGAHAHATKKLGRLPKDPANYARALPFGRYLVVTPPHPTADADGDALSYAMDHNDEWGDCVVAGWDHFLNVISTLLTGTTERLSDAEILALYRTQNPRFDPNGTANGNGPQSPADGGMVIQQFLEYLQQQGKIVAFAKIDHTNADEVRAAIYLGLGIIIGVDLEVAQQNQTTWDYKRSREWGGHCVTWVGFTPDFDECVTWGELVNMTEAFVSHQVDEAWFVLTQHHIDHPAFRNHYDLAGFAAAFTELTGRAFPVPVPPTPAPTPDPGGGGGGDASAFQVALLSYPGAVQMAGDRAARKGMTIDEWGAWRVAGDLGSR